MNAEQLLTYWHKLPEDKQQEVINFIEFLESRLSHKTVKALNQLQTNSIPKCLSQQNP
ncbi:DUF2281 domain-containing protein [Crocosphaera sp. XPORK-15E]|uniref:DUF2281 domain-containing protein n=1 Tax=Crocosphaera sp. XPORK-15E TaxID=3110247 RepID=UPI002B1F0C31|nr:DUF2281 domain-containing protein [Crocosphaera sp. XPORK-15E]MEA5537258.1 DUF2281 domain-containing protein [Crocosphaera sp. XPORK-15E]